MILSFTNNVNSVRLKTTFHFWRRPNFKRENQLINTSIELERWSFRVYFERVRRRKGIETNESNDEILRASPVERTTLIDGRMIF